MYNWAWKYSRNSSKKGLHLFFFQSTHKKADIFIFGNAYIYLVRTKFLEKHLNQSPFFNEFTGCVATGCLSVKSSVNEISLINFF